MTSLPEYKIILSFDDKNSNPIKLEGVLNGVCPDYPNLNINEYSPIKKSMFSWAVGLGFSNHKESYQQLFKGGDTAFYMGIFMAPNLRPETPQFFGMVKKLLLFLLMDDFLEWLIMNEPEGPKLLNDAKECIRHVLEGNFTKISPKLPIFSNYPYFWTVCSAYADFDSDCFQNIPNYRSNSEYFVQEMMRYISAIGLSQNEFLDKMDEKNYQILRTYDSAAIPTLLCIFLLSGIQIPSELRDNFAFEKLLNLAGRHIAFANDILSSLKEISNDHVNIIKFKLDRGQNIQESFKESIQLINGIGKEFQTTGQILQDFFPGDENVTKIVKLARAYLDGHILSYKYCKLRYGHVNIVKL